VPLRQTANIDRLARYHARSSTERATMAKLYFYYSAMNAGKTTTLLQSAYNYHERGMRTLILTPALDNRFGDGVVASRIGLKAPEFFGMDGSVMCSRPL